MILPLTRGVRSPPCRQDATTPLLVRTARSSSSSVAGLVETPFQTALTTSRFTILLLTAGNGVASLARLFPPRPTREAAWAKQHCMATNSTSWEERLPLVVLDRLPVMFITESTFTIQHHRHGGWRQLCQLPCTASRPSWPMGKFSSGAAVPRQGNQLQLFSRYFRVRAAYE